MNKKFIYNIALDKLRKLISNYRINFLIGSGFSYPLLKSQGDIDDILSLVKQSDKKYYKVKAYLLWNYFLKSIYPLMQLNLNISPQKRFTHNAKSILLNKNINMITRQINVFTTNFDPLLELGFQKCDDVHYNDGMYGKTVPVFSVDNYKELKTEQIIYYDDIDKPQEMEIPAVTDKPTLNIFKLHGSLTWKRNIYNNNIEFVDYHKIIYDFYTKYKDVFNSINCNKLNILVNNLKLSDKKIKKNLNKIFDNEINKKLDKKIDSFFEDFYNTFMIVDPFKRKFISEKIEVYYFKLLRVLAKELSKENALLFVFGFSFRDDHIRHIIKHELKNNSLKMFIFCYDKYDIDNFINTFNKNNANINLIYPVKSFYTLNDFNDLLETISESI